MQLNILFIFFNQRILQDYKFSQALQMLWCYTVVIVTANKKYL